MKRNSESPGMPSTPSDKSQQRRIQVLDAAAECFRRSGFHGASMAEIAKVAGMSPGHIYNLFENKDEIIAAIVERDRDEIVQSISEGEQAEDLLKDVLHWVDQSIDGTNEMTDPALSIEVLAEACRNPKLAAVVQASEAVIHEKSAGYVRKALGDQAAALAPGEIGARAVVIGAIFNGLMNQSISMPQMDKEAVKPVVQRVLRQLLTP